MRITLLPDRKEIEVCGRRRVCDLLQELGVLPGTAMVIRGDQLLADHEVLEDDDCVEIRSVISGGV